MKTKPKLVNEDLETVDLLIAPADHPKSAPVASRKYSLKVSSAAYT
jgi:hypothetical protein